MIVGGVAVRQPPAPAIATDRPYRRLPTLADIRFVSQTQWMRHGRELGKWFALANELAETGRYRSITEVEVALKAKNPCAVLPTNKIMRGVIDGTCFRARRAKGWDT
jgi:hypothetical protein